MECILTLRAPDFVITRRYFSLIFLLFNILIHHFQFCCISIFFIAVAWHFDRTMDVSDILLCLDFKKLWSPLSFIIPLFKSPTCVESVDVNILAGMNRNLTSSEKTGSSVCCFNVSFTGMIKLVICIWTNIGSLQLRIFRFRERIG